MPIYEYACSRCGHQLEALQKLADAALTTCPACRAESLVKKVSAAGFQLKGSGWYATDFKSKKPAEKKPEAKSEAKTETKTETKPDAKPASTTTTGD